MAEKNLWNKKMVQSRIHDQDVKPAEKWLGYLLGPSLAFAVGGTDACYRCPAFCRPEGI